MPQKLIIRSQRPNDTEAVRQVYEQAFEQRDEADLVDALISQDYARIALVAQLDDNIVGAILFSDLPIETPQGTFDALALAPLAVIPDKQNKGIGSELVRAGLSACREGDHRVVIVLGDPNYYGRFGFSAELARGLQSPFPRDAFQALELVEHVLQGVQGQVKYPPPFGIE